MFRPSLWWALVVLLLGGIFTLIPGYMALVFIVGPLNDLFGWKLLGIIGSSGPRSDTPEGGFIRVTAMVFSALPGIFAVLAGSAVVSTLRFFIQPSTFDYENGVFRRGRREVCRFSDISAIRLRRITDPNYPDRAQLGLAVLLNDDTTLGLEWQFPFLRYLGKKAADPYTDLGMISSYPRQQAIRQAADEVAKRIGAPLQVFEERGNFNASKGM